MARLTVSLFGPFQCTLGKVPITRFQADTARALLVYLALHAGKPYPRETLAELLWPDRPESVGLHNLRQALNRLRNAIGDRDATPPFLEITRQTIQFNPDSDYEMDLVRFKHLIQTCESHPHRRLDACRPCIRRMQQAAAQYQGTFLAGFYINSLPFGEWLQVERERLHRQAMDALYILAGYHLRRGEYQQARSCAQKQVDLEPWREEAHQQLMRSLALDGQRTAALAHYDTCRRILDEELGVKPAAETTTLFEQIQAGELESSPASLHNLLTQLTPFMGREAELAKISEILSNRECRLLTLVGPGGIGKTRLALQAAVEELGVFRNGVYFVPLVSLDSPEHLIAALAKALQFSLYGGKDHRSQIQDYLRGKDMLLVLDGFERLLAGASLIVQLLQHAPDIKILVTSRERLNVQSEWLIDVEGLAYPQDGKDDAGRYSSLELLLTSARRSLPNFSLSTTEKPYAIRICQLVDGMPLAVELAAAWRKTLSFQEIAQELENNLDFLTTTLGDIPPRHRSLRAVFDYSWNQLDETEKSVFGRLSVFHGGFTRPAAESIANANLPTLAALVDKSLLRLDASGSKDQVVRFGMHDLLRWYATEKLSDQPEEQTSVTEQFGNYFLDFLGTRADALRGQEQRKVLQEISDEIQNVRAAWQWIIRRYQAAGIKAAQESLFRFYYMHSWFQEGERAFSDQVNALSSNNNENSAVLGLALTYQGWFAFHLGQHARSRTLMQRGLALQRELEASKELALSLNYLGAISRHLGEYVEAVEYCQESLAICRDLWDHNGEATALSILGQVNYLLGNLSKAQANCQESLKLEREQGNRWGMAFNLAYLGQVAYAQKAYHEAKHLFAESLDIRREMNDRRGIGLDLNHLGDATLALGKHDKARQFYESGLDTFKEIGYQTGVIQSLTNLGLLACQLGKTGLAEGILAEALDTAIAAGTTPSILHALTGAATVFQTQGKARRAFALAELVRSHLASSPKSKTLARTLGSELATDLVALGDKESALPAAAGQESSQNDTLERLVQKAIQLV